MKYNTNVIILAGQVISNNTSPQSFSPLPPPPTIGLTFLPEGPAGLYEMHVGGARPWTSGRGPLIRTRQRRFQFFGRRVFREGAFVCRRHIRTGQSVLWCVFMWQQGLCNLCLIILYAHAMFRVVLTQGTRGPGPEPGVCMDKCYDTALLQSAAEASGPVKGGANSRVEV